MAKRVFMNCSVRPSILECEDIYELLILLNFFREINFICQNGGLYWKTAIRYVVVCHVIMDFCVLMHIQALVGLARCQDVGPRGGPGTPCRLANAINFFHFRKLGHGESRYRC